MKLDDVNFGNRDFFLLIVRKSKNKIILAQDISRVSRYLHVIPLCLIKKKTFKGIIIRSVMIILIDVVRMFHRFTLFHYITIY